MKTDYETYRSVLSRRDEYLRKKARRRLMITRAAPVFACFCLAAALGLHSWNGSENKSDIPLSPGVGDRPVEEETSAEAPEAATSAVQTSGEEDVAVTTAAVQEKPASATTAASGGADANAPAQENTYTAPAQTAPGAYANAPAASPVVTTASKPNETKLTDYERSILVKKVSLFLAGVMTASGLSIPNANADYDYYGRSSLCYDVCTTDFDSDSYREIYDVRADRIYDAINSGKLDVDFNSDGKIDVTDCRLLYWYDSVRESDSRQPVYVKASDILGNKKYGDLQFLYWSPEYGRRYVANLEITPEILEKLEANSYIDGAGRVYSSTLTYYCILFKGASLENLTPSYYLPEGVTVEALENGGYKSADKEFIKSYFDDMNYARAGYSVIEELIDDGVIDIDANADGAIDINDYIAYNLFIHDLGRHYYPANDLSSCYEAAASETLLPSDVFARVYENYKKIPMFEESYNLRYYTYKTMREYIDAYFASHIDIIPEYFDDRYYLSLVPGLSRSYQLNHFYHLGVEFETAAGRMGLVRDRYAYYYGVDLEALKKDVLDYYIAVKEGRKPEPDVNMDGVVTDEDSYLIRETYIYDQYWNLSPAESQRDEAVWNNIATNCDFNGNGESGDIYDNYCANFYYRIENNIGQTFEAFIDEDEFYSALSESDIERSGDASGDGELKMNDAVLILQSVSNPDKYELDSRQSFNADVYNTGDGVTPMDALKVQKNLLGLD